MTTWGQSVTTNMTNSAAFTNTFRLMGGTSPNVDGMILSSVSVDFSGSGQDCRVAVYQGGTASDPTGATLVEDLGVLNIPGARAFYTKNSTSHPALTKNAVTWIAVKTDTAPTGYWSTSSSDAGDFQTARGRDNITGQTGGVDPDVVFPSTLDGTDNFGNVWYAWYLTYNVGPTIDTHPQADTAIVAGPFADTAVFTVAATTSGGSLSYVWKREGSTVTGDDQFSGQGTTTLTFTPDDASYTADAITCAVTDNNGTTTTNPATLTVKSGETYTAPVGTTNASGQFATEATVTSDDVATGHTRVRITRVCEGVTLGTHTYKKVP